MLKVKIIDSSKLLLMVARLSHQLIESHGDFSNSVLIGLQPRGIHFSSKIRAYLESYLDKSILSGTLDTTFYRDDYRRRDSVLIPNPTHVDFDIEGKRVILVDDVLYTGRSVRAGFDALLDLGRPSQVELLVLINRMNHREFPIEADYLGQNIHSIDSQKVKVELEQTVEDSCVWLLSEKQ